MDSAVGEEYSHAGNVSKPDSSLFQGGDILLRKGNNIVSDMIISAFPGGKGMSHCGILVRGNERWMVIHTISGRISAFDGIRINTVKDFIAGAHQNKVMHVQPVFPINRELVSQRAFYHLQRKAAFDHDFDLNESDKLYCSELVRKVYLEAGVRDVFSYRAIGEKLILDLAIFGDSTLFKEVKLQPSVMQ
ncbi:MAG: YiiX/YebB-like N1pC/P60 family cysteine hydrolase [Candidatus Cloacimonadaceae bacterium]|nr:YiiX/YebB-like N1pC/P60 family cysteine hydrolase [Candidatus Cloacimonadaceae bacterium]